MCTRSLIAVSFGIVLASAAAAPAQNANLPNLDLQKLCQARQSAVKAEIGATINDYVDSCVKSEQKARDQIIKDWATYPASDRALCIQPQVFSPNYVEWITCLEMSKDVRRIQQEQKRTPTAGEPSNSRVRKCPFVEFRVDGSIAGITAC